MAEPRSIRSTPHVPREGAQREPLLATKLRPPAARPGAVPRERLITLLDEATAHKLTVVTAPAGFGKTTLLATWIRRTRHPIAWVTLDEADNDFARFWEYASAALRTVLPALGRQTMALLSAPRPFRIDAALPTLAAELAAAADRATADIVLVLDDYQLMTAEAIHTSLTFLLDHLPPRLHLLIASRAHPPLPLARLRARAELAELDTAALRFTPDEAVAFFRRATGLRIPDEAAATLCARADGWVAGLQLAALALRGHNDISGFVQTFTGSHRYVADYLVDEVLARQPPVVQAFLLATSVLERLSADLCEHVSGQPDARSLLERLDRENLFLIALDDERHWYRYHQLFAEMLRARLRHDQPERAPALHRRAAQWLEENGVLDEAILHALAAADPDWASRMIARAALDVLARGQWTTLRGWIEALPEPLVRSRASLSLLYAWVLLLADELDAVEPHLARAEALLTDTDGDAPQAAAGSSAEGFASRHDMRGFAATARAALAQSRFDAAQMQRYCHQALHELSEDNWRMRGLVAGYLGSAHWMRGEAAQAAHWLEESARMNERGGNAYFALSALCVLAMVQYEQGRFRACRRTCERVLQATALPGKQLAYRVIGAVYREWDDLEAAKRAMEEAIAVAAAERSPDAQAVATLSLARVRRLSGDRAAALDDLERVERMAREGVVSQHIASWAAVARTLAALAWGDLATASAWAASRDLHADDEISPLFEGDYLVLARVLLAQADAASAGRVARRVWVAAEAQERMSNVVEALAIEALAVQAQGDRTAARATIERALALAEPEDIIGVFADEGWPMATLLEGLRDQPGKGQTPAVSPAFLDHVLTATYRRARAHEMPAPSAEAESLPAVLSEALSETLSETLSERELEVLRLVAAGRSNQEIAGDLVVALSTVKTHLNNIYGKLGVRSRTQALARARELRLLSTNPA